MRDTFIGVLFLVGMICGYLYLRQTASLIPSEVSKPLAQAKSQPGKSQSKFNQRKTGVRHAKSSNRHQHQQSKNHGQDEGTANHVAEAQELPSIYQEQSPEAVVAGSSVAGVAQPTSVAAEASTNSNRRPPRRKVVHGVPVDLWVLSKQNSLNVPNEEAPSELGMRVYVQCMELKKQGAKYVGKSECQSLLAHR